MGATVSSSTCDTSSSTTTTTKVPPPSSAAPASVKEKVFTVTPVTLEPRSSTMMSYDDLDTSPVTETSEVTTLMDLYSGQYHEVNPGQYHEVNPGQYDERDPGRYYKGHEGRYQNLESAYPG